MRISLNTQSIEIIHFNGVHSKTVHTQRTFITALPKPVPIGFDAAATEGLLALTVLDATGFFGNFTTVAEALFETICELLIGRYSNARP